MAIRELNVKNIKVAGYKAKDKATAGLYNYWLLNIH
jgi:hypothetical protein